MQRWISWILAVFALIVLGLSLFTKMIFAPVAQDAGALEWAHAVHRGGFVPILIAALVALCLTAWMWRDARRMQRAVSVLSVVILAGAAFLLRWNVTELMFAPLPDPDHVVADAVDLAGDEMVLGVVLGGEAKAWPMRTLAYHHIVNDVVGGAALVATY